MLHRNTLGLGCPAATYESVAVRRVSKLAARRVMQTGVTGALGLSLMRIARVISPRVAPALTASRHASNSSELFDPTTLASFSRTNSLWSSSREVRWEATC